MTTVIGDLTDLLQFCFMVWLLIVLLFLILCICWILFSPLYMEVDTRTPMASLRWTGIGRMRIWYEEEWWLRIQFPFFHKTFKVADMNSRPKRKTKPPAHSASKRKPTIRKFLKILRTLISAVKVEEWQLALDTGDFARNGQLYPINYLPGNFTHLHINFIDQNYLVIKLKIRVWKIVFAFIR
jgi:hypothetical protein